MSYPEQNLGCVIRKYRKERGYTQSSLAEKMGITQRQVMYIENGQSFPKFETLCRFIEILRIPPENLFRPIADDADGVVNSMVELLRSCHQEDQPLVYATLQTLIEQLNRRR